MTNQTGPYEGAAVDYLKRGWSPLSLPAGQKHEPLKGWTGYHGRYVETPEDVEVHAKGHPNGNIGLRVPETVVGIDVDAYGEKIGHQTLAEKEVEHGFLPDTWTSSSREAPSGIRFYRVPAGRAWLDVGKHVETISWHHRYAVVAPSLNPDNDGREYGWRGPDGLPCEPPAVEDLPALPDEWVAALDKGVAVVAPPGDVLPLSADAARKRIDGALARLREAENGTRNNTLNWAAHLVGGLWARVDVDEQTGDLAPDALRDTLEAVARDLGLTGGEVATTRDSGWDAGVADPMKATQERDRIVEDFTVQPGTPPAVAANWPEIPDRLDDAHLAAWLAWKGLDGDWLWGSRGLGWLRWDERRWVPKQEEDVREAVRRTAIRVNKDALDAGFTPDRLKALAGLLSNGRIGSLTTLMRGVLAVEAGQFDQRPDLLNVANGVVDLRTGELLPHDRTLRLTKITETPYEPGARHDDWDAALAALDPEVADWMQERFGQAATGYATSDDILPIGQGGGSNGKSTWIAGLFSALGEHMVLIPDKLLRAGANDHPTELMTLFGVRVAVVEETPEVAQLNVQRLKAVLGTAFITARQVHKDNVTWRATHSLFVMTNYKPIVRETDRGTWRRLALVRFTKTFPRDDRFRARIERGDDGRREAVLAWVVAGAVRWYAAERVLPPAPARVVSDTREWRGESDLVLRYLTDRLVFDGAACVASSDLLDDMNDWLAQHGQQTWGDQLLTQRFGQHEEVLQHRVTKARPKTPRGLVPRPGRQPRAASARPWVWQGVRWRRYADED